MQIRAVSEMNPEEIRQAVAGFAAKYVRDWEEWLSTPASDRVAKLGSILRKWQAGRPYTMRRPRRESRHGPPFLEDLIAQAIPHLRVIKPITLLNVTDVEQRDALHGLWNAFKQLCLEHPANEVGITKAVLLLTSGKIGPAFDSNVRARLGIGRITGLQDWKEVLGEIGADIRSFEHRYGIPLNQAVDSEYRHLKPGRLYDMVLGPRDAARR